MSMQKLNDSGAVLISVVIVLPFLIIIAFNYTRLGANNIGLARKDIFRTQTQMVADAGLDYGMQQITQNNSWLGTGSEITFDTQSNTKTTYQVTVSDVTSDRKLMASTAKLYQPVTATTPLTTLTINADLRKVSSGEYSVVSGVGGLIMSNSAKILGGDVLINGKVTMSNSSQIGLTTNPVNLEVAHKTCPVPPNATYPRLCTSGENGQPISLQNSAKIYGNVKANNQTNGANMSNPGLTASSGVAAQDLPFHDRNAQKAAIASTQTGSSSGCSGGTKSWSANLKITGDVTISNSCKVTVSGNVWITGKLEIKNSSEMIVSNTLGTTRPVVMVDGDTAKFNNSSILRSNSSSTGFQVINYKSDASCSPDCADVTGSDLFNSQADTTIELDNSASGPNTIFYSKWTKVLVKNSGQIGALVGQTVELSNSGTITFGTSTGTGTSYWILDGYRRGN